MCGRLTGAHMKRVTHRRTSSFFRTYVHIESATAFAPASASAARTLLLPIRLLFDSVLLLLLFLHALSL